MTKNQAIDYLHYLLLGAASIFIILAPYEHKYLGKITFAAGLIILFAIKILQYRGGFFHKIFIVRDLIRPFAVFGLACILSIIFSSDPYHSQAIFFDRYLVYVVFFAIGSMIVCQSRKSLYVFSGILLLSLLIYSLGGVRDYFYYCQVNPALKERLWSVFGKRIPFYSFPLYLVFFIPFVFSLFVFAKNKILKGAGLIGSILLFLCLAWNTSRAAWLAIFITLSGMVFIKFKRSRIFVLVFFLIMISLSFYLGDNKERMKTVLDPNSWSNRIPLYQSALRIFRDYPVLGIGLGTFEKFIRYPKYDLASNYPVSRELNLHAHNTYLEVAAEMGIVGLFSFLSIFAVFFWRAFKKIVSPEKDVSWNEQAVFIGLTASVLSALIFAFSTTFIIVGVNNSAYFWLLFGAAAGMLPNSRTLSEKSIP
ncbi:MAG: O-antigen ligase family protein [Candidatus Omnitrophica bacterium]|nr:O-antigen ligase family protein [Candidatus Omnitrophota bacterium]